MLSTATTFSHLIILDSSERIERHLVINVVGLRPGILEDILQTLFSLTPSIPESGVQSNTHFACDAMDTILEP